MENEAFLKLFEYDKPKLIEILKEISDDPNYQNVLTSNPDVVKTIRNDQPKNITLSVWGTIEITPTQITYRGEHAGTNKTIVTFNKFFKLE